MVSLPKCLLVHTECELLIVSVVFNTTRLDGFFTIMTTNMSIFQKVFVTLGGAHAPLQPTGLR